MKKIEKDRKIQNFDELLIEKLKLKFLESVFKNDS